MLVFLSIISAILVVPLFYETGSLLLLVGLVGLSCMTASIALLRSKGNKLAAVVAVAIAVGSFVFLFVMESL